jgi:hypothetical protein
MLDPVANLVKCVVSGTYNARATSITLASGYGNLPSPNFNMVWYNYTDYKDPSDDPNAEIVRVTAQRLGHHGNARNGECA